MLRLITIAEHGRFAFLDTATMRFVEVDGSQTFSNVDDLHEAARAGDARGGVDWDVMNRLIEMAEVATARPPPLARPDAARPRDRGPRPAVGDVGRGVTFAVDMRRADGQDDGMSDVVISAGRQLDTEIGAPEYVKSVRVIDAGSSPIGRIGDVSVDAVFGVSQSVRLVGERLDDGSLRWRADNDPAPAR